MVQVTPGNTYYIGIGVGGAGGAGGGTAGDNGWVGGATNFSDGENVFVSAGGGTSGRGGSDGGGSGGSGLNTPNIGILQRVGSPGYSGSIPEPCATSPGLGSGGTGGIAVANSLDVGSGNGGSGGNAGCGFNSGSSGSDGASGYLLITW